ncbi:MAG TPA: hypothetical protein PKY59_02855 [Pyrinomonadaceae bacterium]|nr:hypothetical protein [Pyrinomonadaceae bacterium]
MSREEIKTFAPDVYYIVISVTDPENSEAEIFDSHFLVDVLRLKFDDVDAANKFKFDFSESKEIYMNESQATQILSFVKKNMEKISLIVCQCEQGVSRSPAIAAALSKILQNKDEFFLNNFWANRSVYNVIIEENKRIK